MAKHFDAGKAAKILAFVLGSPSAGEGASARHTLIRILDAHSIAGRDLLPHHYLDSGDAAVVEQVNNLLQPLWTGDDDAAREQQRAFVDRRLIRWRLGWSDLIERLRSGSSDAATWYWWPRKNIRDLQNCARHARRAMCVHYFTDAARTMVYHRHTETPRWGLLGKVIYHEPSCR